MVIEMNNVVITIARQYGSGGRTIGEMLAKKLNVHYYVKELMKLASDDSGINEALFVNADEKVKSTKLFHIAKKEYHGELIPPESDDFTSTDNLFNYQAKIIRDLAILCHYRTVCGLCVEGLSECPQRIYSCPEGILSGRRSEEA